MNETQQVINTGFFNAEVFIMQQNFLRTETVPLASMQSHAKSLSRRQPH